MKVRNGRVLKSTTGAWIPATTARSLRTRSAWTGAGRPKVPAPHHDRRVAAVHRAPARLGRGRGRPPRPRARLPDGPRRGGRARRRRPLRVGPQPMALRLRWGGGLSREVVGVAGAAEGGGGEQGGG